MIDTTDKQTLYYAVIDKNLIFSPAPDAIAQAQKWHAIHHSKTWQNFIDFTSIDVFNEVILDILEALGYENLYPQYLNGEDLSNYITDLNMPLPTDEFTTDLLPDFDINGYMPILAQEVLACLSIEILDNIGTIQDDEDGEFYYYIDPAAQKAVVATLEAAGYTCQHQPDIMRQATGIKVIEK